MINNRQAGRRRGRGGNASGGGNSGGGQRSGGQGRPDNGNRIDNRARGNANQLYEKYKNLAADSQRQGDRVNTEYYLQFADHYFRVLSDQRGRFEDQQPRRQQPDFDIDGNDDDYGDEGEPIRAGEQQDGGRNGGDRGNDRNGGDRNNGDRNDQRGNEQRYAEPRGERSERPPRRDGRQQEGRQQEGRPQQDRQQQDRQQQDYREDGDRQPRRWDNQGDDAGEEAPRAERQPRRQDTRSDGERQERQPRRWERDTPQQAEVETEVAGQRRADPPAPGENLEARAEAVLEADAPLVAPRRRGRPRRDASIEAAPESRTEGNGVDADRLPPSLGISAAPANEADGDEPRPRRRRARAVVADAATD
ncbi:DUF4167 domain-containing protein [Sphingomonas sp. Leaf343]|uniref:DUF4167 domain-containing protein n=1 Tax=Sphingomonas sp. Leaf343 TaxID=1736345 RepID=UPI0006FA885C|nr:DUF4167 domain-containing protein [Sphingomonas sp. Leaf343]KQR83415.1 hypothetical protein ASG07_06675 [Sphingomonas sp. Leaf343]